MGSGPLTGLRIVELAGLAPVPFAAMVLADLGAEVVRVDRVPAGSDEPPNPLGRGRRSVGVNLKSPAGVAVVLRLADQADVLLEGFRPGVVERLGVGPDECLARNPRLVYGRLTGWGRDGPLAAQAGHDINYISLSGALYPMGHPGVAPRPPLNLLGDFGGGGLLLAFGVLAALHERDRSGAGQVVDAAMVDGAALLTTQLQVVRATGRWFAERGTNVLDGSAPYYTTYATADGQFVSVGALEPRFYAEFVRLLGLAPDELPAQHDRASWPCLRQRIAEVISQRTRDEWERVFAGSDACVTPVLRPDEAPDHPHNWARDTFIESNGVTQPAPAPRFSRTPAAVRGAPPSAGQHTDEALAGWGFHAAEIQELRRAGAVG